LIDSNSTLKVNIGSAPEIGVFLFLEEQLFRLSETREWVEVPWEANVLRQKNTRGYGGLIRSVVRDGDDWLVAGFTSFLLKSDFSRAVAFPRQAFGDGFLKVDGHYRLTSTEYLVTPDGIDQPFWVWGLEYLVGPRPRFEGQFFVHDAYSELVELIEVVDWENRSDRVSARLADSSNVGSMNSRTVSVSTRKIPALTTVTDLASGAFIAPNSEPYEVGFEQLVGLYVSNSGEFREGPITGFPCSHFGDMLVAYGDVLLAAYDRLIYQIDLDSFVAKPVANVSNQCVGLVLHNSSIVALTKPEFGPFPDAESVPL
jgi:hypothetical protein